MFSPQVCLALGLLSLCTLSVDSRVSRENMFPFGPSNGDSTLPNCLSCYEGPVKLKMPFWLSGQEYNELYVNTDGIISFNSGIDFYPKTCGDRSSHRGLLIAPFWTDVDTRRGGHVYYRESTDPDILDRASKEVLKAFSPAVVFQHLQMNSAFIVTWDNVSYARSDSCSDTFDRNTFQAVLATDAGGSNFAIFYYNDLTWTGGLFGAAGWTCEWQLKDHASAGVSLGHEDDFHDILGNCPSPVLNLVGKSNINEPGKWIFQLDGYFTEKGATAASVTAPTRQITTNGPTRLTSPTMYREEIVMPMKLTHMMRKVMSFISLNFLI